MVVVVQESHFEVKNIVTVWDKIWLVFEEVKYFVRPTLPNVAHPTGIKRDTRVHVKIPGRMIGHRVSFSSLFGLNAGQFHPKRTRFEVTTSKTSFLGTNMLVRPHVVH